MVDTATTLNQAYQLIEQGELAQARTLLQPLLISDADNPDVWWLYTHAAEDPAEGQRALDRVLALRPDYAGATELRQQMGAPVTAKPSLKPLQPATGPVDKEGFDDDFGDVEETQPPRRSPVVWALVAVVVLGVAAVFALFLSQALQTPATETPTQVANATSESALFTQEPITTPEVILPFSTDGVVATSELSAATEESTVTEAVIGTEENIVTEEPANPTEIAIVPPTNSPTEVVVATQEPLEPSPTSELLPSVTTAPIDVSPTVAGNEGSPTVIGVTAQSAMGDTQALETELLHASIPFDSITTKPTRLGNTLVVQACGVPGPDASRVLTSIMNIMAEQVTTYGVGVEALGVNISDCNQGSEGRIVAVPIGTAGAYARHEIDVRVFQSLWRAVE